MEMAKDLIIEGKRTEFTKLQKKSVTAQIHNISVRYLKIYRSFSAGVQGICKVGKRKK